MFKYVYPRPCPPTPVLHTHAVAVSLALDSFIGVIPDPQGTLFFVILHGTRRETLRSSVPQNAETFRASIH